MKVDSSLLVNIKRLGVGEISMGNKEVITKKLNLRDNGKGTGGRNHYTLLVRI